MPNLIGIRNDPTSPSSLLNILQVLVAIRAQLPSDWMVSSSTSSVKTSLTSLAHGGRHLSPPLISRRQYFILSFITACRFWPPDSFQLKLYPISSGHCFWDKHVSTHFILLRVWKGICGPLFLPEISITAHILVAVSYVHFSSPLRGQALSLGYIVSKQQEGLEGSQTLSWDNAGSLPCSLAGHLPQTQVWHWKGSSEGCLPNRRHSLVCRWCGILLPPSWLLQQCPKPWWPPLYVQRANRSSLVGMWLKAQWPQSTMSKGKLDNLLKWDQKGRKPGCNQCCRPRHLKTNKKTTTHTQL